MNKEELKENFVDKLKSRNSEIDISETNPIFIRLMELKKEYQLSHKKGESSSKAAYLVDSLSVHKSDTVFNFGINKGKTINEVLHSKDSQYLLWCITELDNFALDLQLMLNQRLIRDWKYHKALEHNLLKNMFLDKLWAIEEEEYERFHSRRSNYDDDSDSFEDLFEDHAGVASLNFD